LESVKFRGGSIYGGSISRPPLRYQRGEMPVMPTTT